MTNKIKQVETANFGRLGWGGAVFKWRAIPVLHKGWNLTLFFHHRWGSQDAKWLTWGHAAFSSRARLTIIAALLYTLDSGNTLTYFTDGETEAQRRNLPNFTQHMSEPGCEPRSGSQVLAVNHWVLLLPPPVLYLVTMCWLPCCHLEWCQRNCFPSIWLLQVFSILENGIRFSPVYHTLTWELVLMKWI